MNEIIKNALEKGKTLRADLDKAKEDELKKQEADRKAKEEKKLARLQSKADRYLSSIPDGLAKAVAERKSSFTIMTYERDHREAYDNLSKLIEPKLKEMGLEFKHTTDNAWVPLSYDPDTGYDETYLNLEVIVPDEGL